ncbi:Nif11-like leader peptide family natural product precursor [Plectonema radiosum NIES-515]|uniref:Nif11-like leader peptide family natural product n=1 Tax=Plectonema radiosum NIES-515 TaxID=2986073 RepID=A0ABT3AV32_9CYAN|nr:Nif11-like leader peptide family natural product precursor [Plectonema radiosum]MCV3212960.1 Nif11-like leader peptide family natural product precursor [Plectonema radiosum NIES-515]
MSKEAVINLYEAIFNSEELQQELHAITRPEEIIKLGARNGYSFTLEDIAQADASYPRENSKPLLSNDFSDDSVSNNFPQFYHYEFAFSEIPGFEEIAQEFEKLKIKPSTVDLNLYQQSFREEDLKSTYVSPDSPGFKQLYDKLQNSYLDLDIPSPKPDYAWCPFHLINLDFYVDHPLYEDYFRTKVKLLKLLKDFFATDVRSSGSLWYPPNSYRLWHTNETQPGWRMYLVDFDYFKPQVEGEAFFRYMNPKTKELVTLEEKPKVVRFFKIESEPSKLFWHCIANTTKSNRWSFGFQISSKWMNKLLHVS